MNSLGVYFGPSSISIIETKGRKIVNKIEVNRLTVPGLDSEDKLGDEQKTISLIADELTKYKIDAKEATLCLHGKDLIIRTFELPIMPREELIGAINFEVRKYIPFKTEDLIFDSQVFFDKTSRTNLILYIGIKRDILGRYVKILNKANLKTGSIEYSAFSIIRLLKILNLNTKGTIGVLALDLRGEDEINLTVLDNGFPVFSRDISFPKTLDNLKSAQEKDLDSILEKLKAEIRVSLDYYLRKFPDKHVKNLFVFSSKNDFSLAEPAFLELGLSLKFADLKKYIDTSEAHYLSLAKGYSSSLYKSIPSRLTINLLAAAAREGISKEKRPGSAASLLTGLKIDVRIAGVCIFLMALTQFFGFTRAKEIKRGLGKIMGAQVKLSQINTDVSNKELIEINKRYKNKYNNLDSLVKKQLYLTEVLNIIPKVLPDGIWITKINYYKADADRAELKLEGNAYLEGQSEKEFSTVSNFVADLKKDPVFSKYFNNTVIQSLRSNKYRDEIITVFEISCKNY